MKSRSVFAAACLISAVQFATAAEPAAEPTVASSLSDLRNMLRDAEKSVNEYYMPTSKVGREFAKRCDETTRALGSAQSVNEAYALISDALCSVDSRIRFYPPILAANVDYGWDWRLIGDAAYVDQLDQSGAARQKGLRLGDRILAIEGLPVDRGDYQLLYHLFNSLSPRPGLRVVAQSPGEEPRFLALESTVRERARLRQVQWDRLVLLQRALTAKEEQRRKEFLEPKNHVRPVGKVAVWNGTELYRTPAEVNDACELLQDSDAAIIDLRGCYLRDHRTAVRLLEFLFAREFEIGRIAKDGVDTNLRVKGRKDAFLGNVLVLIDATTGGYAELVAHVLQHEQRAVVAGDRSMGRVFEEVTVRRSTGRLESFYNTTVALPAGEVILTDGTQLDGQGVVPDYQVLPKPADLAERRDIVLSKSLAMLKQELSPTDAYKLFPHYGDEDDEY